MHATAALLDAPFCHAPDRGDMRAYAELAGVDAETARRIRDRVGDCGACRLASIELAAQPDHEWIRVQPLSPLEITFYTAQVGQPLLER